MKHEDLYLLEDAVRNANPIPHSDTLMGSDEASRVLLMVRSQNHIAPAPSVFPVIPTRPGQPAETEPVPVSRDLWTRPTVAFGMACIVVLGTIGIVALVQSGQPDVANVLSPTATTRPVTSPNPDSLFGTPTVMEGMARAYCESWPDVGRHLADTVEFADVPDGEGWNRQLEPAKGRTVVETALAATYSTVDCGGPAIVAGDWVALPVTATGPDASVEQGIWALRIVGNRIAWHLAYGTEINEPVAASTDPDAKIAAEARSFCGLVEGNGPRNAQAVLDAMTANPAAHNIPNGLHYEGVSGIEAMVGWYPTGVAISCDELTTTNGVWSAAATTLDSRSPDESLIGLTVQRHSDGKIHRQYFHWTQWSGATGWGLPIEG